MTASTTTMASSTTVPMASTNAKSVSRLREKPTTLATAKVPTKEMMMETEGTMVALKSCRNRYTIKITRMMAMISVSITLCMEACRKSSEVSNCLNSNPAGKLFESFSSTWLISALTWVALAPGAWLMMNSTPG